MTQDYSNPGNGSNQDQAMLKKLESLNTVGTISYILHLIVAVGALIPGGQFGPVLLIVALIIDLVKRSEAEGFASRPREPGAQNRAAVYPPLASDSWWPAA